MVGQHQSLGFKPNLLQDNCSKNTYLNIVTAVFAGLVVEAAVS